MWEKHPRVFLQLADETDPEFLGDGLLIDLAYEEEFSQIILPYNKKMVDNDLESTISEIQSSNLYKEKKLYEKELYGDFK